MHTCQNPECGKAIPEGRDFCDERCLRRALELKKEKKYQKSSAYQQQFQSDPKVEEVLRYIGIVKDNFTKSVAYVHWYRFIEMIIRYSGGSWEDLIKPRLRSYIGISFRYLDDYLRCCVSWGIVKLENGRLFFLGIPEEEPDDADSA